VRTVDKEAVADAVARLLHALGYETEGELVGTSGRVADAWVDELTSGERRDPAEPLLEGRIPCGADTGPVVLHGLTVATMCPHHLLPSHGRASIGYFPGDHIAGLGAVHQALERASRRLILQESLGELVADALLRGLGARGAFCRLELVHSCFVVRGERAHGSTVESLALRGSCLDDDRHLASTLAFGGRR
jgi:GTP cyclohydrolase IA